MPAREAAAERRGSDYIDAGPSRPPPSAPPGNLGPALPPPVTDDAEARRRFAANLSEAAALTGSTTQRRHTPDSLARHLGILRGVVIAPIHSERLLAIHAASSDDDLDARLAVTRAAAPDRPWAYFSRLFDDSGNPAQLRPQKAEEEEYDPNALL